ncbi:MAG: 2-phosphosulfolactate phosphatase [Limisphaerales bacterium]
MNKKIEVTFTPADFNALADRDISGAVCVVFDILRATTTMTAALANGAKAIIPVCTIEEAVKLRQERPEVLLAGERDGVKIRAKQAGGVDFDLGNSPREFTEDVAGKTIITTTTNGTRALRACVGAKNVLIASMLNLRTIATWIEKNDVDHLVLVCAGTHEEAAYEDMVGAGALCEMVWPLFVAGHVADSAEMARQTYRIVQRDLLSAMQYAQNGRRLLANPDLAEDVRFCMQRETLPILAGMNDAGEVTLI